MVSSKKSMLVILVWGIAVCLYGNAPLRLSNLNEFPTRYQVCGTRILQAKHIMPSRSSDVIESWCFPTSIVVDNVSYAVKGQETFQISTTTSPFECLAEGMVCRMPNVQDARICGFGVLGMNNLGVMSYAPKVSVSVLDSSTNIIFATDQRCSVYVYKNLFLTMRGPTNHLEFASALISAGLPPQVAP